MNVYFKAFDKLLALGLITNIPCYWTRHFYKGYRISLLFLVECDGKVNFVGASILDQGVNLHLSLYLCY